MLQYVIFYNINSSRHNNPINIESRLLENNAKIFKSFFKGKAIFDPGKSIDNAQDLIEEKQAILFNSGDKFWVKAADEGIRFILLSAKPLKEPIAWGGPIVMNTQEELIKAFQKLDTNTFIKNH